MALTPGSRLGHYEVLGTLGVGGMGEVYRARDVRLDRPVALKVLPADLVNDVDPSAGSGSPRAKSRGERRQRFEREARAASRLNHPHICTIFDIGEQEGQPYLVRDVNKETPVSDAVFAVYKDQFSYSEKDLEAHTDATDDTSPDFVREKVSFTAAYAGDRVIAILFLPKGAVPPYQTVIFCPGSWQQTHSANSDTTIRGLDLDYVVKSGRAWVFPVYYGTYERNSTGVTPAMVTPTRQHRDAYTDILVRIGRDFRRTVDYLESRDDIDSSRLAFLGFSWGGKLGPVMTAIEPRIKAAVLVLGGLGPNDAARPEALQFNYLPRSRVPTLMLNGRYDMIYPLHSDVQPMFDHLGTPAGQKRLVLYETDHFIPRQELIKETLAWLDKYLGPVSR